MFYKLLGIAAWKGIKLVLRQKYGAAMAPKPLLAGGIVAVLLGGAVAARGALSGSDDSS
jgi:hypothetical protein